MSSSAPPLDVFAPDCRMPAQVVPAINIEPRRIGPTDILILHYTGLPTFERSLRALTCAEGKVSCHYLVDVDGTITQLVPEALRAWHAGVSVWAGETDINSRSIGIEIQNAGHGPDMSPPPPFPPIQLDAVLRLGRDIVARNAIPARRVLAHSDIAPMRKTDPGETFPWAELAAAGLGVCVEPEPFSAGPPLDAGADVIAHAQGLLAAYGYGVPVTGAMDALTTPVIAAFQRHFRPARVDGVLDRSTLLTLERLVDRHVPELRVA